MKVKTFAMALAIAVSSISSAQIVLENLNSRAVIDPTSSEPRFRRGMTSWQVDGVNQLFQQWYWYRVGNSAEKSIDDLGSLSFTQHNAFSATVSYSDSRIAVDLQFTLIGGSAGSGASDVSEVVRIRNLTSNTIEMSLFEYDDFDLGGSAEDDQATLVNSSTIGQNDANGNSLMVGATPPFANYQIAAVPTLFDLLDNNVADNLANTGSGTGPADVAFATQWNLSLGAGDTFIMSKNKVLETVPEPATLIALSACTLGLLARRRTKR